MGILIVDDIAENIYLLQTILEGANHRVTAARNGREALDCLQKESFDVIISDGLMPVMDGFQLCRECKTNPDHQNIPFVFYTAAYTDKNDEAFALSLGADAYILKPQEPDIFLKAIAAIIEKRPPQDNPAPPARSMDELNYLFEHNRRLIAKLEGKMVELEQNNLALQASEKKYRLLAENAQDVIFVLDLDLNYTYVSPSMMQLCGYQPAEVVGQAVSTTLTRASADLAAGILIEEMATEITGTTDPGRSRSLEIELLRRNETPVWTEVKMSFLRNEENQPAGILGAVRDIAERKKAEQALSKTMADLRQALYGTSQAIARIVEARDPYTAGHQKRVALLACAIAGELGFDEERVEGLRMGASIHDLGKIAVPAEVLSKPTKLSPLEMGLIRVHSQIGYEILKEIDFPWPVAQMVHQHHEKMDGSGYPNGLAGKDILTESRIICIADVVEAIASHRPYRPALAIDTALDEIKKNAGILYDNAVVDACLRLFREKGYALQKV